MKITQHTAVSIHYRLTNAKGELIESSFEAEPMLYLHGAENMIPGLEAALEGKSAGDKLDVNVDSEQAYYSTTMVSNKKCQSALLVISKISYRACVLLRKQKWDNAQFKSQQLMMILSLLMVITRLQDNR